eukprot:NODE_248_length_11794_cov_0.876015.p1 type:complete len:968 gc:universal NODE_248_length_11794_cov_0.876015:6797-9700(+)
MQSDQKSKKELTAQDYSKISCLLRELEIYSDQDICQFVMDACNADTLDLNLEDDGMSLLNARTSSYGAKLAIRMNEMIDSDILEYMASRVERQSQIRNRYHNVKRHQAQLAMNKIAPIEEELLSIEDIPEIVDQDYDHISPQDSDEEYGIPTKRRSSFAVERPEKRAKLNEVKQWTLLSKRVVKHARHFPKTFIVKHLNSIKDVAKHQISHVELLSKCKQLTKDVGVFIRKKDKIEREYRKKAEKEQYEKAKAEEEKRESQRQARKLNFLITQTEIYSHFVGKKDQAENDDKNGMIIDQPIDFDNEDEELLKRQAADKAQSAYLKTQAHANEFNQVSSSGIENIQQPDLLKCTLKSYQLKGLNWLAGLYEQGINGILADEMGLGKTVQSISLLAYVAEKYGIWGPFLVVTPASTLHNWQNEFSKFTPSFKTVPYWGNSKERQSMRSQFRAKGIWSEESAAHVIITSYQLAVQDQQYLSKLKWQFLILDEAHSIKSSSSVRWNTLLKFNCRNRLLLTGTPIQNSLQELWALLHFIMPTLFDSHQEFAEWFSKGIEGDTKSMNEHQLKRLQAILKPFMLRRVKSDVENELPEKIEKELPCPLTHHQRRMYRLLKKKVNLKDLLEKANLSNNKTDDTLMNLMMHFRKITNHPELFERSDVTSPFHFSEIKFGEIEESSDLHMHSGKWTYFRYPSLIGAAFLNNIEVKKIFRQKTNIFSHRYTNDDYLNWTAGYSKSRLGIARMLLDDLQVSVPSGLSIKKLQPFEPFYIPSVTCEGLRITFGSLEIDKAYYSDLDRSMRKNLILSHGLPLTIWEKHLGTNIDRTNIDPDELQMLQSLYDQDKPYGTASLGRRNNTFLKVPTINDLISSSGKLLVLDDLLPKLKEQGHKVLLYFQMTKMMDIMEEYLTYRAFQFVRLDGSTSIEERNEKVQKFQDNDELFIFILSTRAGGVGINLTSADTVIFYDQDWNPT